MVVEQLDIVGLSARDSPAPRLAPNDERPRSILTIGDFWVATHRASACEGGRVDEARHQWCVWPTDERTESASCLPVQRSC